MKKMDMGILTDTDMKRPRYKLLYALIAVLLIIYCFAVLIPVVWIILSGFKNVKELYAVPSSFFPILLSINAPPFLHTFVYYTLHRMEVQINF